METENKTTRRPGHLNDGTRLEVTDRIFCDPEFDADALRSGKKPKLEIPANVLSVGAATARVEIIDETLNGHRHFTNTDLYGSTCYVLIESIKRNKE